MRILFPYITILAVFGILHALPSTTWRTIVLGIRLCRYVHPYKCPRYPLGRQTFHRRWTLGDFPRVDWLDSPTYRYSFFKPRGRPLQLSFEYPLPIDHLGPQHWHGHSTGMQISRVWHSLLRPANHRLPFESASPGRFGDSLLRPATACD